MSNSENLLRAGRDAGPCGPFPPTGPWLLARAAGELHGDAVRSYVGDARESGGDTGAHIRRILSRLRQAHALSKGEVSQLERIVALLGNRHGSSRDALNVVRGVHHALVDQEASPCAIALANIAENSVRLAIELETDDDTAFKINWGSLLGEDLKGAGAGALSGAAVAGVGAVGGAIAGACVGSGIELVKQSQS